MVAPYSGAMLAMVARSATDIVRQALAVEFDEFVHHVVAAEDLRDDQHQVGGRRAFGKLAVQPEADDLRGEHVNRLAQHARLGLDAADAPAQNAQAVDHGGMAVGPDQAVGEGHAVAHLHHLGQIFQVHLVDDTRGRRNDAEIPERLLAPFEEFVPLAVALEFALALLNRAKRLPKSSTCTL